MKLEQAARQALEALLDSDDGGGLRYTEVQAVAALREALAEQAEQEPVAWMNDSTPMGVFARHKEGAENFGCTIPLYAVPVRTKDLTDDEIHKLWSDAELDITWFARAVIAKFKEKNK